jgi:hypothetical protein
MEDDVVPLDTGPIIPPDPTPPPVGQPFQIKSVALTSGYRTKDQFKIVWNVWGDESEIDHYYVYLFVVRPEMLPAAQWDWNNGMALCQTVPAGQHSYTGHLTNAPPEPLSPQHQYLRPMVVAVPKNSSLTPHTGVGAARALFSSLASEQAAAQAFWLPHSYLWSGGGGGWQQFTPGPLPPPPGNSRAVWRGGPLPSSAGIPFTTAAPGSNVYIRPYANTHWIVLQFQASNVGPGNYHILGHAGFGGGPGVPNTAKMQTRHYLAKMAPTTANTGWSARTPVNAQALPNPVAQERLDLFQDHIATNALPGGTRYQILYEVMVFFQGPPTTNYEFPTALFGVRLMRP